MVRAIYFSTILKFSGALVDYVQRAWLMSMSCGVPQKTMPKDHIQPKIPATMRQYFPIYSTSYSGYGLFILY